MYTAVCHRSIPILGSIIATCSMNNNSANCNPNETPTSMDRQTSTQCYANQARLTLMTDFRLSFQSQC